MANPRAVPRRMSAGVILVDPQGRVLRLQQDGWDITYAYRSQDGADRLPRRLDIKSEAQTIRLVIDNWQ